MFLFFLIEMILSKNQITIFNKSFLLVVNIKKEQFEKELDEKKHYKNGA